MPCQRFHHHHRHPNHHHTNQQNDQNNWKRIRSLLNVWVSVKPSWGKRQETFSVSIAHGARGQKQIMVLMILVMMMRTILWQRNQIPHYVLLMPKWYHSLWILWSMVVVMVTNLILCMNHENDELRLMMKTRLLPEQRRALASTNPALFLIIQRCLRHFSLRSSKMCFHPGPNPKGHNLVELLHWRHWSKV